MCGKFTKNFSNKASESQKSLNLSVEIIVFFNFSTEILVDFDINDYFCTR